MTRNNRKVVYTIANSILRPPIYLTNIIIVTFLFRIKQEKLLFLKNLYKNSDICRFLFHIFLKKASSLVLITILSLGQVYLEIQLTYSVFNAQSGIGHSFSQKEVFNPSSTHHSQLIIEVVI